MTKKDSGIQQPSTVQSEPQRRVIPTHQQTSPPQQPQQQLPQSISEPRPDQQQQFMIGRMQPYPVNSQQQQQQQQFVAMQPYQVNGALPAPHFGVVQQRPLQVALQSPQQQGAVFLGQAVQPSPPPRRYRAKASKTLGFLQITVAVVSAILGITAIMVDTWASFVAAPIWGAVFFYLPAGILGVISTKPTNGQQCLVNSCLAMSVLAAIIAATNTSLAIAACFSEYYYDGYGYYYQRAGNIPLDVVNALVAFAELIIAFVQSIYCCCFKCDCCRSTSDESVQYVPRVRYVAPSSQNLQPVMYPMQQQQQPQQIIMQQQQQYIAGMQSVTPLQSAPRNISTAVPNTDSDYTLPPDGGNEPVLPEYSDSPPPSYSLSTGHM